MKKTQEVRTWKSMCGANHGGGEADDGGHQWLDQWPLMSGVMVCLCEREPKSKRDEGLSRETTTVVEGGRVVWEFWKNVFPLFQW